jgi:hypothetical protein
MLATGPLAVLPSVAVLYTHLNVGQRLFVNRLGCGCGPFFNTNHLSWTVGWGLVLGTAIAWWFATSGLSPRWRAVGFTLFVALSLVFIRQFMYYNEWA